jgi:hypothetical protein
MDWSKAVPIIGAVVGYIGGGIVGAVLLWLVASSVVWGVRYEHNRRQERNAARRRIENRTGRPWRPTA